MPTNVGLVLRAKTVDVIEVTRRFRNYRLSKVVCVPMQGTGDAHVVEAIRTAMANATPRPSRIGVTVAAQEILLRAFTMPLLPKSEREAGVGFEARKYIPFRTEDLAWSCHLTERRPTKQMHVVFIGIRTQTLTRIQGWLQEAGVLPAFIESQSVSLSRVVAVPPRGKPGPCVGLVDVDVVGNVAHIVVVRDRIPYFSRDVRLQDQAEVAASTSQEPDGRAKLLLSELRLSLDFFARENPSVAVEELALFGDPTVVGSWVSWLAEQLNRRVVMGTLPMADRSGHDIPPQHACAVGLILKGLQSPRIPLEFAQHKLLVGRAGVGARASLQQQVPEALNKLATKVRKTVTAQFTKTVVVQVSSAACLLALLIGLGSYRVQQARAELLRVTQSLSDSSLDEQPPQLEPSPEVLPPVIAGLEHRSPGELQSVKEAIDRRLGLLQNAIQGRLIVTDKLSLLVELLPEGIWLDGLTFSTNADSSGAFRQPSLTIIGSCFLPESRNELDVISALSAQLKRHTAFFQGFRTSQLGEISIRDAGPETTYRTFTLTLKGEGAGQ